ncbi:MAG: outer-membrane lipoprotein carrier protein LolA [candidate division WOR-3 bacterium]|uniref:Outer membrane lipoprotein carrier protein LolA n=1 Tax=candidate division WOR-3 bacterium TaxID=2052148 RepID=A0A7C3EMA4_UNCW3|nr:outer-membrane lipoprotein carrier protein LolA [candidate division WOR-3 bacterium]
MRYTAFFRQTVLLIILAAALGLGSPADRWQTLRNRYLGLKSLAGSFTETIKPAENTGQEPLIFKGSFLFQLPHNFRLEVQEPVRQTIVGNDSVVWFYFPDEQRAVRQQRNQPVPLLAFVEPLLDTSSRITEEGTGIILIENDNSFLSPLRLELDPTGTTVTGLTFTDELGNQCRFLLNRQRWNPPVSRKNFRFTPPRGVTVEFQ